MYLKNVARAKTAEPFWADWKIVDPRRTMPAGWQAHVRVHNMTSVDEIAFCTGVPPEYKGNPEELRYMLRTRFGENLETQFLSVIEPYNAEPFIREVRALRNEIGSGEGAARAAVEVLLADGRRDVILFAEDVADFEAGGVRMQGRVGLVRFGADGKAQTARLFEGTRLEGGGADVSLPQAAYSGRLERFDMSDVENTRLHLDSDLPAEGVEGKYVIFANSERSDASYPIVKREGVRTLNIGVTSLVERFVDAEDYDKGLIYNMAPGDAFRITQNGGWDAR